MKTPSEYETATGSRPLWPRELCMRRHDGFAILLEIDAPKCRSWAESRLGRGFASLDETEDCPGRMLRWKRVWVSDGRAAFMIEQCVWRRDYSREQAPKPPKTSDPRSDRHRGPRQHEPGGPYTASDRRRYVGAAEGSGSRCTVRRHRHKPGDFAL